MSILKNKFSVWNKKVLPLPFFRIEFWLREVVASNFCHFQGFTLFMNDNDECVLRVLKDWNGLLSDHIDPIETDNTSRLGLSIVQTMQYLKSLFLSRRSIKRVKEGHLKCRIVTCLNRIKVLQFYQASKIGESGHQSDAQCIMHFILIDSPFSPDKTGISSSEISSGFLNFTFSLIFILLPLVIFVLWNLFWSDTSLLFQQRLRTNK